MVKLNDYMTIYVDDEIYFWINEHKPNVINTDTFIETVRNKGTLKFYNYLNIEYTVRFLSTSEAHQLCMQFNKPIPEIKSGPMLVERTGYPDLVSAYSYEHSQPELIYNKSFKDEVDKLESKSTKEKNIINLIISKTLK
jgi:hypothetical protein